MKAQTLYKNLATECKRLLSQGREWLREPRNQKIAAATGAALALFIILLTTRASAVTALLLPNADITTQWPNVVGSTDHFDAVNDGDTPDTASYIGTGTGNADGAGTERFGMESAPNVEEATSVTLYMYAQNAQDGNNSPDTINMDLFINGTSVASDSVTPVVGSWGWFSVTATGSWNQSDIDSLEAQFVQVVEGGGQPASRQSDIRIASVYMEVDYTVSVNTEQSSYRWFENSDTVSSGEFSKLPDPSDAPTGVGRGTAFSPDGQYMSVAHSLSPYITIYEVDSTTNTFAKLPDPSDLPNGIGEDVAFSPDGKYMSVVSSSPPFLTIYEVDSETNTFTKLPDPSDLPPNVGYSTSFSPDGKYMSVAHFSAPYVTIYEVDSETNTFTKLPDPSDLPAYTGKGTTFSPDGRYMSVVHDFAPYITIYEVDSETNTFTKLPNPSDLPTGHGSDTAFSPDGQYMSVSHVADPYITIYEVDSATNTFTKLPDPSDLPPNTGQSTAFSPDGKYMSVTHSDTPYITIYEVDSTTNTFAKLPDPSDLPPDISLGTAFSPDGKYMSVAHSTGPYITIYEFIPFAGVDNPLAAQDTPVEAPAEGVPFRLRASVSADQGELPSDQEFKLQYADLGPDAVCSTDFTGANYQDVHESNERGDLNSIDKLSDPSESPAGSGRGTAFSPDGQYMSVAHHGSPFITIYEVDSNTGTFTKLPNPSELPAGLGRATAFSPDGQYMSVAHDVSPYIAIYEIDSETNTFTKLPNPSELPTGIGEGVAFSPNGQYMSVSHNMSPHVTIYEIDSETNTFTKLPNPSELPAGGGLGTAFSPDGQYMSVAHSTSPFVTIYEVDSTTNTFTKLPNPSELPALTGWDTAFSPDGQYMSVSHSGSPFVTIYEIDSTTNTFTKLPNPSELPTDYGNGVTFSPNGQYMSVSHSGSPFVTIYEIDASTNTFTKLPNPSELPAGIGQAAAFSPDGQYMSVAHEQSPRVTIYEFDFDGLPVQFYDNSQIPSGAGIAASADDPSPGGTGSAVLQSYVESNTFINPNAIPDGDYGIWDFALVNNGTVPLSTYCFRIVSSDGGELTTYSVMPELNTPPPDLDQNSYRWFEQATGTQEFGDSGIIQTNPTGAADAAYANIVDGDYVYVVGYQGGSGNDWRIEKRNKHTGELCTTNTCGAEFGDGGAVVESFSTGDDRAWGVAVDDNHIYITGEDSRNGAQWRTEKRSKHTGELDTSFGDSGVITYNYGSLDSKAYSVAVDEDYLYISGYEGVASGHTQIRIEKRNKSTGELCASTAECAGGEFATDGFYRNDYNPGGNETPQAIAINDTSIYYTVRTDSSDGDLLIEKLDINNGSLITSNTYRATAGIRTQTGTNALVLDDEYLYVAGQDGVVGDSSDWFAIKANNTTLELCANSTVCAAGEFGDGGWLTEAFSSDDDNMTAIEIDNDYVYMAGLSREGGTSGWIIQKRDIATGSLVGSFGDGGSVEYRPSTGHDEPRALAVEGNFMWVSGYDFVPGDFQWNTQKRTTTDGSLVDVAFTEATEPLAAQDTAVEAPEAGVPFNLRATASTEQDLPANLLDLKLQYAELGPGAVCNADFTGLTYEDVGLTGKLNHTASLSSNNMDGVSDVTVSGDYAYVANWWDRSLTIVDISDHANPFEVGSYKDVDWLNGAGAVAVSGDYAFVTGYFSNSLVSIDISDPSNPTRVSIRQSTSILNGPRDVVVSGDYAYVASQSSDGLAIFDITDPSNMSTVGTIFNSNMQAARDVAVSGDYAYVINTSGGDSNFTVIDISNPSNPTEIDVWSSYNHMRGAQGVYVQGDYAYVAGRSTDSMTILNISDPMNVTHTNTIIDEDNLGGARDVTVLGNYAYVVGDIKNVLSAIDITEPTNPVVTETIFDSPSISLDSPYGVTARDNYVYVAGFSSNNLAVFDSTDQTSVSFQNNPSIPNGTPVSASPDDPSPGSGSAVMQSYVENNSFTNPNAISAGNYGIWDFSLVISDTSEATYCFRIVYDDGELLTDYSSLPQLNVFAEGPSLLTFTTPSRTVTAGTCSGGGNIISVEIQDSDGQATSPNGETVIRITSNSTGYTVYEDDGCSTEATDGDFTVSDSESSFSFYIIDTAKSDPTWTLTAEQQSGPGNLSSDTQNLTVEAGPLANYDVTATTPVIAGECVSADNLIEAYDAWGNLRDTDSSTAILTHDGSDITFYTDDSCATSTTQVNLSNGAADYYFRTERKQTGVNITATKDGDVIDGTSNAVTVDPAPVETLLTVLPGQTYTDGSGVSGSPNFPGDSSPDATVGNSFTVDLKAVDTFGNLVDTGSNEYSGNQTLDFSNSSAPNAPDGTPADFPASPVSFIAGSAEGLSLTYYAASGSQTVRADDSANTITGTESTSFTVAPASADSYTVAPESSSVTAGESFDVTITALDSWENELGSHYSAPTGTYEWSTTASNAPDSTSPNIGTLSDEDFTNGSATLSVTLYAAESGITFTAGEPSASSVGGTSEAISVSPGFISSDTSNSSVSASSTDVDTEESTTITITLRDAWNNPVSGVSPSNITIQGTSSPSITQPSSSTSASGQTTGSISWPSAGTETVTIAINGVTLVTGDGTTVDSSGQLDDSVVITVSDGDPGEPEPEDDNNRTIQGGTTIRGGTRIE